MRIFVAGPISVETTETAAIRINSGLVFTEKARAISHSTIGSGNRSIGKGIDLANFIHSKSCESAVVIPVKIDLFEDIMENPANKHSII
jgi:hypothetical protein